MLVEMGMEWSLASVIWTIAYPFSCWLVVGRLVLCCCSQRTGELSLLVYDYDRSATLRMLRKIAHLILQLMQHDDDNTCVLCKYCTPHMHNINNIHIERAALFVRSFVCHVRVMFELKITPGNKIIPRTLLQGDYSPVELDKLGSNWWLVLHATQSG